MVFDCDHAVVLVCQLCRAYDVLEATGERPTHVEPPLSKALKPWDPWTRRR